MSRSTRKTTMRVAVAALVTTLLAACGSDLSDAELLAGSGALGSAATGGAAGVGRPGGSSAGGSAGASTDGAAAGPGGSADPATAAPTGGATQGDPSGGAAAIPQATDRTPIRIGTLGVFSGVLGTAMQPGLDAIKAWVAATNAAGGLGGRPIELIVADDRGDPNLAVQLAHRLVETDRVVAILGSMQPATVQAVVDYFDEVQVPVIGTCACTPVIGGHPMFFPVGATDGPGVTWGHIAGIFDATEARKAAVFYCREAATCTLYRNSLQQYEGHDGFDIVYEAQISLAAPDFTAEVLAARNAGAEIIISVTENPTAIRIMRSAHRQGYNPLLSVQHGGDDSNFVADGGSEIEGAVYTSTTASWATSALMADYRDAIAQYAPDGSLGSLGSPLWMSGEMLERVAQTFPIDRAVTSADIIEGLYSLQGETLGGRVAPTTYNRGGGNELANTCVVPMAIRDGEPTPQIGPEEFVCAPL